MPQKSFRQALNEALHSEMARDPSVAVLGENIGLSPKIGDARDVDAGYTLDGLADDAFGVLDAIGLSSAQVIGQSMGGMVAQIMAPRRPQRVRSLCLTAPGFGPYLERRSRALDDPATLYALARTRRRWKRSSSANASRARPPIASTRPGFANGPSGVSRDATRRPAPPGKPRRCAACPSGIGGLDVRKADLTELLANAQETPPLLHPNMPEIYRQRISALYESRQSEDGKAEAAEVFRRLVDQVTLVPDEAELAIVLRDALAAIPRFAAHRKTPTSFRRPGFWVPCLRKNRWLRGQDLNLRPSGYEPDELPGCSTPREPLMVWA